MCVDGANNQIADARRVRLRRGGGLEGLSAALGGDLLGVGTWVVGVGAVDTGLLGAAVDVAEVAAQAVYVHTVDAPTRIA